MPKEWKIKSQRKDPVSLIIHCKFCTTKPTRWYKLMTTTVYRCEEHKKMISSPVYDQGKLSSKGECIGMEFNPTFEAGVSKITEYNNKSGQPPDIERLNKELNSCTVDHEWIEQSDPEHEEKIKTWVVEHLRINHPFLFASMTYYDENGEHNLIFENPDEYFLTKLSKDQVTDHYQVTIPPELVGMDISSREIKQR